MERGFYNEDFNFEELVRQQADRYRMYPSESVWKVIYSNLHTKRRWYWTGFLLILGTAGYLSTKSFLTPQQISRQNTSQATESNFIAAGMQGKGIVTPDNLLASPTPQSVRINHRPELGLVTSKVNTGEFIASKQIPAAVPNVALRTLFPDGAHRTSPLRKSITSGSFPADVFAAAVRLPDQRKALQTVSTKRQAVPLSLFNELQDKAVQSITASRMKRVSWQLSVTPTMNVRRLSGNNQVNLTSDIKNVPIALNFSGNIDNMVIHKPAMGLEVGSLFLYALNKRLSFKTGVQFNYFSYDIQAYSTAISERATISLSNYSGIAELTSYTQLRNFGGSALKDLKNEFFHISTPVGLEWVVLGRRKLQLAVAGTLQPTYHLNRNNYLITTDYKNFTKAPSLVRRWNMNASTEAFIAYKSKGMKYQLGPQFRYQLLSSYSDKYPVREFLMEYGLKFAVSRDVR